MSTNDGHRSYAVLPHHLGSIDQGAVATECNGGMIHYPLNRGVIQYCRVTEIAVRDDTQELIASDNGQLVDAMLGEVHGRAQ
jgi:hypothetical protein